MLNNQIIIIIIIINLFAIFSYQIAGMQWQATRKTQSSTSWWPIINRTVVDILLCKKYTMKQKKEKN